MTRYEAIETIHRRACLFNTT